MKIDEIATSGGPDVYYSDRFRVVLEDHMTYLRNHPQTYYKEVNSKQAYKFEGDFFGLLSELNLPVEFYWLIMRMNKLTSPVYTESTITSIIVPSNDVIERIRSAFMNVNKIKN